MGGGVIFCMGDFSWEGVVINLPRTYEKLPCKEEPDRFSGYRDPSAQTDIQTDTQINRQTFCYFIIRIEVLQGKLEVKIVVNEIYHSVF